LKRAGFNPFGKTLEIPKGQPGHWQAVYQAAAEQMVTNWQRFLEDASRLKQGEPPDIGLVVTEAQMLHLQWQNDQPSYMRSYLDNGVWGKMKSGMDWCVRCSMFSWVCICCPAVWLKHC
jgi:hypothetical protein